MLTTQLLTITPACTQQTINHIYNDDCKQLTINKLLQQDPTTWQLSASNELGSLANGIRDIKGNKAIVYILKDAVPPDKKVTYANMVCDYCPDKDNQYWTCLTIGGDKLDYFGNTASPAASLLKTKLLINSVISNSHRGARFASLDIKDHFLQSDLPDPKYMQINSKYFFDDIRTTYNINSLIFSNGYVYCKIVCGMYGLKQVAMLGRNKVIEVLKPFNSALDTFAPNLWSHSTRPTKFCLCVDNFGVKFYTQADLDHLINIVAYIYV